MSRCEPPESSQQIGDGPSALGQKRGSQEEDEPILSGSREYRSERREQRQGFIG